MKKSMKIYLIIILTFCLTFIVRANENEYSAGVVYGSNGAFKISAPYGRVLNNRVALSQGLHCVLYLEFATWYDSPVVMYAQISGYSNKDEFINYAIETMSKESRIFKYEKVLDTLLFNKYETTIYDYSGLPDKNLNRVAYIQVPNATCYIVFSARYKTDFDNYKNALNEILESFVYSADYQDLLESQSGNKSLYYKDSSKVILSDPYEISWDRTPNQVINSPKKSEIFLWFGVIDSIRIKPISSDTVEISWFCKYQKLKDPSLELFNKKYINYFETSNNENFFLSIVANMTRKEAIKATICFIPGFSYVLAFGEYYQTVNLGNVNAVQIIGEKFLVVEEPDVRKIK
jgi:hypothetical protein